MAPVTLSVTAAFAQAAFGRLAGVALDPSANGTFLFPQVPLGIYDATIALAGFKSLTYRRRSC